MKKKGNRFHGDFHRKKKTANLDTRILFLSFQYKKKKKKKKRKQRKGKRKETQGQFFLIWASAFWFPISSSFYTTSQNQNNLFKFIYSKRAFDLECLLFVCLFNCLFDFFLEFFMFYKTKTKTNIEYIIDAKGQNRSFGVFLCFITDEVQQKNAKKSQKTPKSDAFDIFCAWDFFFSSVFNPSFCWFMFSLGFWASKPKGNCDLILLW